MIDPLTIKPLLKKVYEDAQVLGNYVTFEEYFDDEFNNVDMELNYNVKWDSPTGLERYSQDFETIDEARIALALHSKYNAELSISKK